MTLSFQRTIAFLFLLLGLALAAYIFRLDNTLMIGDSFGYDPGSKIIPAAAVLVFVVFATIDFIAENKTAHSETSKPIAWKTLVVYLGLMGGVILAFVEIGYILTAGTMIYLMLVVNSSNSSSTRSKSSLVAGIPILFAGLVATYTFVRKIIRSLFSYARELDMYVLREPFLQALVVLVALVGLFGIIHWGANKWQRNSQRYRFVMLSITTTMLIYVVFRLFFLVQLPPGWLNW